MFAEALDVNLIICTVTGLCYFPHIVTAFCIGETRSSYLITEGFMLRDMCDVCWDIDLTPLQM